MKTDESNELQASSHQPKEILIKTINYLLSKGHSLHIKTTNQIYLIKPKDKFYKLDELQSYVDGYIEYYPYQLGNHSVIFNEEGNIQNLDTNHLVSEILGTKIVGNVVIINNKNL